MCEAEITNKVTSIALNILELHIEKFQLGSTNTITLVMVGVWSDNKNLLTLQETTVKLLTEANLQKIAVKAIYCKEASSVVQVDFAENYTCQQQDEIQSVYWSQEQVTLFNIAMWAKDLANKTTCHSFVIKGLMGLKACSQFTFNMADDCDDACFEGYLGEALSSLNENGGNTLLKEEQKKAIKHLFERKDLLAVLPTGFGKSLIFQLLVLMTRTARSGNFNGLLVMVNKGDGPHNVRKRNRIPSSRDEEFSREKRH
ncbi:hypothetical protein ACROYT_G014120 [Oculina patagonica]